MKIKRIIINNFLSIGHADVMLDGGMVLIQGDNKDSPVSDSNGAGKSSLAEAITFALYGKTKRATNGDSVVNRTAGKDCYVEVVFEGLRIVRYRKHSSYKNEFHVFSLSDDGIETDITKGTVKDTDQMFQELIGMSELTFNKIAYFGQGDVASFASLTDAELKQVFEQGFGLVFFQEYLSKIKQYKLDLQGEIQKVATDKQKYEMKIQHCDEMIAYYMDAIEGFRKQCCDQKDQINQNISDFQNQLNEISNRSVVSLKEYETKLNDYSSTKDAITRLKNDLKSLHSTKQSELEALYNKKSATEAYKKEIKTLLNNIAKSQSKVGTNCPTCGKEIVESDVKGYVETNTKTALDKKEHYQKLDIEWQEQQKIVDSISEKYSGLEQKLEMLDQKCEELNKVQVEFEKSKGIQTQIDTINGQIKKLTGMIAEIEARKNPYIEKVEDEKKNRQKTIKELEEIVATMDEMESEAELTSHLESIFGNSGMKSYIFDNLTPRLNELTNKYLSALDDIEVEISTQRELKSGEKREKFEVVVDNHHGANSYKGLSGGEKRKVDLAISLAFNTMVRDMTSTPCNMLFLDEVLESLDDSSSEKVMELLSEFADGVENVFVISHNDSIKDLFAKSWTVTKQNNMSSIICN